jgi:transposase-like protein
MENNSEVLSGLVVAHRRDGRCRYDPQVKQELVKRCLYPGVSVAALAMRHGVNANLLRKWIAQWQSRNAIAVQYAAPEIAPQNASPFLAVQVHTDAPNSRLTVATKTSAALNNPASQSMHLRVQLPNGVAVDLGQTRLQDLSTVMQTLCSLSCSS